MQERAKGLGLRGQLALILGVAFALGCAALLALALRLESATEGRLHQARASTLAGFVEAALDAQPLAALRSPLEASLGEGGALGIRVRVDGRDALTLGSEGGHRVLGRSPKGRVELTLWVRPARDTPWRPWSRLLAGAFASVGALVVLLSLGALTRLLVSPIARLTAAAEQLEAGDTEARVPIAGAREVAQLGLSFNRMAKELTAERRALAEKLLALERTTTELRATQAQVVQSEKLASVGRLSAGLAHEIGNPLAAILGLVELLQSGGLSAAEQADFLARVHRETVRIHGILRELLDFARGRPESPVEGASADLAEAVRDAEHLLRPQRDARGVHITLRCAPDVPPVVGTAEELTQVVLNLLLNATDAIDGAGSISVQLERDGEMAVLRVADSGPGISEEVASRLFEPFVTTKPEGKGTGLGLAVCQGIVTRRGGSIEAHNAAGGGAVFCVRLPLYAINTG